MKAQSFTLIEMIVSLTIVVLIMGAIYALFSLHQQSFKIAQEREELVQNSRVILERLSREIRQAKEIITSLPETPDIQDFPPSSEIAFQDGHLPTINETANPQSATQNTITLASSASEEPDYYKGAFIKIVSGSGEGQIRKIIEYNPTTKVATIGGSWEILPESSSLYKIDTFYYYVRYYLEDNNLKRSVTVYYFSGTPNTFVPWNATPPQNQTRESIVLEDDVVGEYVNDIDF